MNIPTPPTPQKISDPKRDEFLKIEAQIYQLKFSNTEFTTKDLHYTEHDFLHYTLIHKIPQTDKNVLVVIHGYAGFGGNFYKLMAELANKYYIVLVDLPDMGFSSRQKVTPFHDTLSTINYFVSKLEIFIQKMGFDQFTLMGHSIGAYLAAHLFAKLHSQIIKLLLLSPAGFNDVDDPFFIDQKKHYMEKLPFYQRYFIRKIETKLYVEKKSFFEMFGMPMTLKKWLTRKFWLNPRFNITVEESTLFSSISSYFITLNQSGDRCIGYLLHYGLCSKQPVINVLLSLKDHSDKINLFFGDKDRMDGYSTQLNLKKQNLEIPVFFISNSEHQLIFQNPSEIAMHILKGDILTGAENLEKIQE